MTMAWEISQDDVFTVLQKHGKVQSVTDPLVEQAHDTVCNEGDRVEEAALCYNSMDCQATSALDEIEDILIEEGLLSGPKLFQAPEEDEDSEDEDFDDEDFDDEDEEEDEDDDSDDDESDEDD